MSETRNLWDFVYQEFGVKNPPLDETALS
ncbi:MAG: hypothetical protein ACJARN_001422, partial [Arenicella sp.]